MKKQSKIKNIKEDKIENDYVEDKMDKSSLIKNMFQSLILICAGLCIFYGLYSIFFGESKTQNQTAKLEYKDVRKLYGYLKHGQYLLFIKKMRYYFQILMKILYLAN